jgi:hypothetical protein
MKFVWVAAAILKFYPKKRRGGTVLLASLASLQRRCIAVKRSISRKSPSRRDAGWKPDGFKSRRDG